MFEENEKLDYNVITELHVSSVVDAAYDAKIKVALHAAEIIKLIIELKSNNEILEYMHSTYGAEWKGKSHIRKFNTLMQSFILYNYSDKFKIYCEYNAIFLFDDDLDVKRGDHTYARIIFITFLREMIGLRYPIKIIV